MYMEKGGEEIYKECRGRGRGEAMLYMSSPVIECQFILFNIFDERD